MSIFTKINTVILTLIRHNLILHYIREGALKHGYFSRKAFFIQNYDSQNI